MNPLLDIPFAGGLDEATRPELVNAGSSFTELENVRQDKRGGATKRLGVEYLTTTELDGGAVSSGRAIVPLGQTVSCVDSGGTLRTYSPTAARWVEKSRAPEVMPTRIPMPTPGGTTVGCDVAYANGYVAVASFGYDLTTTLVYRLVVTIYDEAGGSVVRTDSFAADLDTQIFRLCSVGDSVVIVYLNAAVAGAGDFRVGYIDLTSASTVNAGWTVGDAAVSDCASDEVGEIDICAVSPTQFAMAYVLGSGTNRLKLAKFTVGTSSPTASTTIATASTTPDAVALAFDDSADIWVGWSISTSLWLAKHAALTLASSATAATIFGATGTATSLGIASISDTQCRVVGAQHGAGVARTFAGTGVVSAGACAGSGGLHTSFRLFATSKPWVYSSRVYVVAVPLDDASDENAERMAFVCDVTEDNGTTRVAAAPAARQILISAGAYTGNVVQVSEGRFFAGIVTQRSALVGSAGASLEVAQLDYTDTRRWRSSEFAEAAYLPGGVVSFFDGQRAEEAGFLVRPDAPVATATGTAGNPNATAVKYIAVYQKTDMHGNVHWSAPSDPSNAVSPASKKVNVVCTTLQVTQHHDSSNNTNPTHIVLFRSGDNGALPYQRVMGPTLGTSIADVASDYSVSTMTLVDDEASVTANQTLYRQPSQVNAELQHQCPPACSILYPYNGSLVGVADDGITLFYSAARIPGEGVWWNDVFQTPIAEEGPITALAAMDGTLFVFKRSAIFALSGVAPSGAGNDGGLGDYRRLASDVGCIDPRSVVTTSFGVFFQSARGIEILTRAQSVEWVGEPVQATLASYPIVTAATLDTAASIVRFECAASETSGQVSSAGVGLVYDLSLKAWVSVDKVTASGTSPRSAQAAGMVYSGGAYRYARLDFNGVLYVERASSDASAHMDSDWVTQRATTGWVHVAGLQAEQVVQEVLLLAEQHTDHDITIALAYDYADTWTDTKTFTRAQLTTLARQWLSKEVVQGTHQAVRIRVTDATPTGGTVGTGKGATWVALTPMGEAHRGGKRTSAAQRGG